MPVRVLEFKTQQTWFRQVCTVATALAIALSFASVAASGQRDGQSSASRANPRDYAQPSMFELHMTALGERVKTPGRERTVMAGELVDGAGSRFRVEVTHQFPDLLEARGAFPEKASLKFNGERVVLPLSPGEEALLESFTADTVENLIEAERSGIAIRALGFNFISDTESPGKPEPRLDVYQVTLSAKTRPDGEKRTKLFWFDSTSHLLLRTTYSMGAARVETRFMNWGTIDGSRYPGRVERYEDGRLVFAFVVNAISARPKADTASFR